MTKDITPPWKVALDEHEATVKAAVDAEKARVALHEQANTSILAGEKPLDELDPSIIGRPYTGRR